MSRASHEPKRHIHDRLCSELNEMSIRLKLHKMDLSEESAEQQAKIGEARRRHPEPTTDELIDLIDRCRTEMNQCTEPYKRY